MYTLDKKIQIHRRTLYMSGAPTDIERAKVFARELKNKNITSIILLLSYPEIRSLYGNHDSIYYAYKSAGIRVEHFPLLEKGIPPSFLDMSLMMMKLLSLFRAGQDIMITCLDGEDRTGLIVLGLLITLGMTMDIAQHKLREVHETYLSDSQMTFLKGYIQHLHSNKTKRH